ncbi:MAG: FAD binding domain-containing protein [Acidobacteriaceae bacterium]|nr:FAD binding domain-containing protein [Acidobacteriaceae bacterium]
MAEARYYRPNSLEEAAQILAEQGGSILSGGTDFFPSLGERPVSGTLVDISAIGSMRGIVSTTHEHRIGGLTTWSDVIASPLPCCFDALKSAAREIGGVQIQNRGTIAGNLCNASPAADGVPPLLALDAEVELVSEAAIRRMPLAEFIVGNRKTLRRPNEILAAVIVPRTMDDAKSCFLKLGARRYLVISIAMVAVVLKTNETGVIVDSRVAVGACSVAAQGLRALESELIGVAANAGIGSVVRQEHLSALAPIDDLRATKDYRMDAAQTLISRALEQCVRSC